MVLSNKLKIIIGKNIIDIEVRILLTIFRNDWTCAGKSKKLMQTASDFIDVKLLILVNLTIQNKDVQFYYLKEHRNLIKDFRILLFNYINILKCYRTNSLEHLSEAKIINFMWEDIEYSRKSEKIGFVFKVFEKLAKIKHFSKLIMHPVLSLLPYLIPFRNPLLAAPLILH